MKSNAITLRTFLLIALASTQLGVAFSQQLSSTTTSVAGNDVENICGRDALEVTPFKRDTLQRAQYPWIAAIYKKSNTSLNFICVGTLIAARTVVTPAHCAKALTTAEGLVSVGRHDLQDYAEQGYKASNVASILLHPQYDQFGEADIALLHLREAISFDDASNIRPICLGQDSDKLDDITDEIATVAGWERTSEVSSIPSPRYASNVKILSREECLRADAIFSAISQNAFCVEILDRHCQPFSGNGLMIKSNGRWQLRGFAIFGKLHSCDRIIFTDVASYLPWLRANIL